MKDRVPVNPGRVLITPENGIAAYYATMTRADNPTQEGTPLNKNSLLKDATAALFGLGTDALPDDVLRKIASDIPNLYVWKKTGASYVEIVPTLSGPTGTTYSVGYNNESIQYSDELEVVSGALKLKNPSTVTITTSNYTSYSALLCGKYFTVTSNAGSKNYLHFGDDTALQIKSNTAGSYVAKGGWYISSYTVKTVTPDYGYVCSFDKNAYPPAVSDGFIYTALGMLGSALESAKIATGSYVGTGTLSRNIALGIEADLVIVLMTQARGNLNNVNEWYQRIGVAGKNNYNGWGSASNANCGSYIISGSNLVLQADAAMYADRAMNANGKTYSWWAFKA